MHKYRKQLLDFDKLVDHEVGKMRREFNAYRGANQIAFVRSGVRLDSGELLM